MTIPANGAEEVERARLEGFPEDVILGEGMALDANDVSERVDLDELVTRPTRQQPTRRARAHQGAGFDLRAWNLDVVALAARDW